MSVRKIGLFTKGQSQSDTILSAFYVTRCALADADSPLGNLAAKMVKLGAELADEEKTNGITKLRYMQYREETSTTATLGWRIEAVVKPGQPPSWS